MGEGCRGAEPRKSFFVLNFRDRVGSFVCVPSGVGRGWNSLTILKTGMSCSFNRLNDSVNRRISVSATSMRSSEVKL